MPSTTRVAKAMREHDDQAARALVGQKIRQPGQRHDMDGDIFAIDAAAGAGAGKPGGTEQREHFR